jgi:hypothetical protein
MKLLRLFQNPVSFSIDFRKSGLKMSFSTRFGCTALRLSSLEIPESIYPLSQFGANMTGRRIKITAEV